MRVLALTVILCALGVLSAVYGLMVFSLRSGTAFFLTWFVIAALCFFGAFLIHRQVKPALWVRIAIGAAGALLIAALALSLAAILTGFDDKGEEGLDCIVVLGAQVTAEGPGNVLRYRLDAAYDYLAANPGTICIVCGGQGWNEPASEASVMGDYLVARGIDPSRIILEDSSTSTLENLRFALPMIPDGTSVGVVTNNFHVTRAVLMAKAEGYKNVCGIAAGMPALWLPNSLLRETISLTLHRLAGNI